MHVEAAHDWAFCMAEGVDVCTRPIISNQLSDNAGIWEENQRWGSIISLEMVS
jgi:hypothetical protein